MTQDELQAVRARIGSYFNTSENIKNQCALNALCLSLAEVRMSTGITRIDVVASGDRLSVSNDAPPLSIEATKTMPTAESLFTDLRSCHAHPGHAGFEAVLCKGGIATVNAISASSRIITGTGDKAMVQKFSVGKPLGGFNEVSAAVNGTRLDFELDKRWSGGGDFDLAAIEVAVRSVGVDLQGIEMTVKDS